jgi:hypothetical protein
VDDFERVVGDRLFAAGERGAVPEDLAQRIVRKVAVRRRRRRSVVVFGAAVAVAVVVAVPALGVLERDSTRTVATRLDRRRRRQRWVLLRRTYRI